jgi:dihydroneopterin aldolase
MIYDKIIIKNLVARHRVGVDSWQREKVQTVKICLTLFTDINEASQNDTLTSSHYFKLCRATKYLSNTRGLDVSNCSHLLSTIRCR